MARKPPQVYNVHSAITGAQVIVGVSLAQARSECARLNAEARMPHPDRQGEAWGMQAGQVTTYEVRSADSGLVVA